VSLGLAPSEFWAMTPVEFSAVCTAYIRSRPGYVEPITFEEMEAMRKRFPDGPSKRKVH
jgi:uncharacterized phage protein (TIGR02216 family)